MKKFKIDHDLHIHTALSLCSRDPGETTEAILDYGLKNGYKVLAVTDHFWDEKIPGASDWYKIQNFEHISQSMPLPSNDGIRFHFGCETEMRMDGLVAISPETCEKTDFIIVPTTHLHMHGLTIDPEKDDSAESRARLWESRFERLLQQKLPSGKTGIAHLTCPLMGGRGAAFEKHIDIVKELDAKKMAELFTEACRQNIGIELNMPIFAYNEEQIEIIMRPYRIARDCGCKFYLGSDAHHPKKLEEAPQVFERILQIFGLGEADKFDFLQ